MITRPAPAVATGDEDAAGRASPVIAVSAVCMGLGAALGFTPGFVATALRDDLGISRGQVGLLVSLYFGCTGIGSVMGGRLTDRLGARRVVALDMASVAAAGLLSAAIGTYWSLLLAALVAGSGYALVNAGTNVAIGRAVPARRRTLAMSVKTAGVPLMAMVAAAIGPWAADRWSWQHLSVAVAVLAAGATVAALVVLDDDRPPPGAPRPTGELPDGFIWFPIGAFLLIAGSQPLYSWAVAYMEQSLHASPGVAGGISAAASGIGVAFMVLNALRSDRLGADTRGRWLLTLLALNLVATVAVLAGATVGLALVAVGTVIGIAAQLSSIGTMHAMVVDRAPTMIARATGWTMTGYYLGALLSPAAFGALADVTDTFAWSWAATAMLIALAVPTWRRAARVAIARPTALDVRRSREERP